MSPARLTAAERHRAVLRYKLGERSSVIARAFGCTAPNIITLAKRRGVAPLTKRTVRTDFEQFVKAQR